MLFCKWRKSYWLCALFERNFEDLLNMEVLNFNEFSNHTPISINLKIGLYRSSTMITVFKTYYKLEDTQKYEYVHSVQNENDLLYTVCQEEMLIDVTVEKFTVFITERENPLF